jgi:hypothetical protein
MAADLITVNGFTFCCEHGDEVCYRCTYDFRDQNNYSIQDELDEQISELLSDVSRVLFFSSEFDFA